MKRVAATPPSQSVPATPRRLSQPPNVMETFDEHATRASRPPCCDEGVAATRSGSGIVSEKSSSSYCPSSFSKFEEENEDEDEQGKT